jgi:hypothetical protein
MIRLISMPPLWLSGSRRRPNAATVAQCQGAAAEGQNLRCARARLAWSCGMTLGSHWHGPGMPTATEAQAAPGGKGPRRVEAASETRLELAGGVGCQCQRAPRRPGAAAGIRVAAAASPPGPRRRGSFPSASRAPMVIGVMCTGSRKAKVLRATAQNPVEQTYSGLLPARRGCCRSSELAQKSSQTKALPVFQAPKVATVTCGFSFCSCYTARVIAGWPVVALPVAHAPTAAGPLRSV